MFQKASVSRSAWINGRKSKASVGTKQDRRGRKKREEKKIQKEIKKRKNKNNASVCNANAHAIKGKARIVD